MDFDTFVSIHAPTQGATIMAYFCKSTNLFQSTRPRRARRPRHGPHNTPVCFNPRAHAGRD